MTRYTDSPLPPYTYVPGRAPHPIGDPNGHGCAGPELSCSCDMSGWLRFEGYEWAVDLFNAGYFWEAHEAWEAIWLLVGRQGPVADFIKGLIKLAAAGVKMHEGNTVGMHRHAARALELFASVEAQHYGRQDVAGLREIASWFASLDDLEAITDPKSPPRMHPDFLMTLSDK